MTIMPLNSGTLVLLILYDILCAIVSAVIASTKYRSGIGFFFLSLLFLGPLAVGVAVLAAPGVPPPPLQPMRKPSAATKPSGTARIRKPSEPASTATARARVKDLGSEIDSKLADFDSGRISLEELETFLTRTEASLKKDAATSPQHPHGT
jgi:hypothetical protein